MIFMSKSQGWAIFCAMKLDVRNVSILYEDAHSFIDRFNKGDTTVVDELIALGAVSKGKVTNKSTAKKNWQSLWNEAHEAGMAAAKKCVPTPMVVVGHENPLDDSSPVEKAWLVPNGPCGFAWVNVRPGNCAFANWLKKNKLARGAYRGGVDIWVREFGQSLELKAAYAGAFANVIHAQGIKAYSDSKMD